MKILCILLALVLGTLFFQYRYLAPEAGINTRSPDYSNHISIEQHLKEGFFFPELEKSEKGLHAVSRYLPVYHGLLGFHVAAWLIESLGVPLPGAYQLIMDICLAIYLGFFIYILIGECRLEKRWEYLLALFAGTIFFSNFASGVDAAFFSQIMSYALALLALYFWRNEKFKICTGLFVFSVFTYPDLLIWLLPALIITKNFEIPKFVKVFMVVAWVTLVIVLYSRRNLVGPEALSLYPLFFLPMIGILFWKQLYRDRKDFLLLLLSYIVAVTGFLLITQRNFTFSYYAVKLTYPAVFFLSYAFLKMRFFDSSRGRALASIYIFFFFSFANINPPAMLGYFTRSEVLNNELYSSMLRTRKVIDELCEPSRTLVLPEATDSSMVQDMPRVWIKNSLLRNSDMSSVELKAAPFKQMYSSFNSFVYAFSGSQGVEEGRKQFFEALKKVTPVSQDICIVSPASDRSLFKDNHCFVILEEEGGQIYARCQAKAEF